MGQALRVVCIVLAVVAAVLVWAQVGEKRVGGLRGVRDAEEAIGTTHTSLKGVEIVVTSPEPNAVIASPLTVTGEAPGFWFFEATFPIVVVNWDGLIIGESYAQAQGEWMTQEMVPFVGTVEFDNGSVVEEAKQAIVGALILQRDNPSGLPENDDAIEFSIRFSR